MRLIKSDPLIVAMTDNQVFIQEDTEIQLLNNINNKTMYNDWVLTPIQYSVPRTVVIHKLTFSYIESFRRFKGMHLKGVYYNRIDNCWTEMKSEINTSNDTITITVPLGVECFGFIINTAWYSSFTQNLADEYPLWTAVKNETDSVGQQFLNFFGLTIEEVTDWIKWTQEQKYVDSLDINQIDYAFFYEIPFSVEFANENYPFKVFDLSGIELNEMYSIREFFDNYKNRGYMLDVENRKIFTRRDYGNLKVIQGNEEITLFKKMHHIWNSIDEMALLFGIMRIEGESNRNLQQRILEVFKYPSGAHEMGLIYGMARELLLMQRVIWTDDTKDFYIKSNGRYVLPKSIHIDHKPIGKYVLDSDVIFYDNGDIRIKSLSKFEEHIVTFVKDIKMYELHDKNNEELRDIMFREDGQASAKLLKWTDEIKQVSPIMWDQTRWDKNYWDTVDKKATGLGYIPNQWDSDLDMWEDK